MSVTHYRIPPSTLYLRSRKMPEEEKNTFADLEAVKNMKEELASMKEQNAKLLAQNQKLVSDFINESPSGLVTEEGADTNTEEQVLMSNEEIEETRKTLFSKELNNLDYCKNALKLRNGILDKEGRDIFATAGHKVDTNDPYDKEGAQKVADLMQYCIDNCEDDPEVFNSLFSSRIQDVSHLMIRR